MRGKSSSVVGKEGGFPASDASARLLVVVLASLASAPILVCAAVVLSGYQFVDQAYGIAYLFIAAGGFFGLLLGNIVFAIGRSPTLGFAFVGLLSSLLLAFLSFALVLPAVV